ncbi:pentatricopeptide repeat-containing protein At4g30700-like [Olea europaea var. sylvestris]|uniref:pentatricopeptide repeat-containing protein At4g30700-like n=1 Tax=Olea europaea var. sylvestris TaxID=158386 RepID=UPI000C1CF01B|nr:pentatricopeptide repeat-containing protein At4g30700-like [Olea europaea var. sylvestris]
MICRATVSRDGNFFLSLINRAKTHSHLNQTHAQIIHNNILNDNITITKLVQKLLDLKATAQAKLLFTHTKSPDLFLYNVLIKGLKAYPFDSLLVYKNLRQQTTLVPDNFTYSFIIFAFSGASLSGSEKFGVLLHGQAIISGFGTDLFVGSALVDIYGSLEHCDIWVFNGMVKRTMRIDSTTLAVVLSGIAELQEMSFGMMLQSLAYRLVAIFTSMCLLPDLIAYNAMISGYSFNNKTESSVQLFKELLFSVEKVNSSTMVGLIPVFHPFGHLELTSLIHGFCFGILELHDIRLCPKWLSHFFVKCRILILIQILSHPVTITSILSACSQLGALSLGKWVHDLIKRESIESNIYVATALIDMYAKCGSIKEARRLFDMTRDKNVVTWNAMISGYGLHGHGHGHEALLLFDEMLCSAVPPTGVTFLSILYACSHAGLVTEGEKIFHSMVHEHCFKPSPEHYACMVDILGRAGKLQDALEFINGMLIEPGPAEWGALLGACVIHKDTNLAHLAFDKLFELDPENVGYNVLLSNIYSTEHNYSWAALVREVVKKRNLVKTPGCTLIEVKGHPHVFMSSDWSHPESKSIYAMLEKLIDKMRDVGYQMETITALHDVEEEEKELMVKVHSEKLAIVFGLITSEPGEEIRIIKNLRVCLDCHNFTKFVSKITERIIVVRDANRFHHFEDGTCSCGDYW